jgi:GT2 family glycosyltransferase
MTETSIILVNYNNSGDTIKCLETITDRESRISIVIIDNHSSDAVVQQLEKYLKKSRLNTLLIKNKNNVGFGNANNQGIEYILKKGAVDFVFILNNDTCLHQDTIQILQEALTADERAAIAVPRIAFLDDPSKMWYAGGKINWFKGLPTVYDYGKSIGNSDILTPRYVTFATGCAMMIRSTVLHKIGSFRKEFFAYAEDIEFSLRCVRAGWKIIYVPRAMIEHKVQASMNKVGGEFFPILHPLNVNLAFYVYHIVRNVLITMSLHGKGLNRIKFWIGFPAYWMYKNMQFICTGRIDGIKAFFRGWKDFLILRYSGENLNSETT